MTAQAKKVEVKVYLEGIEIPVNRIQILESVGVTPQASLQVPLNEIALDILPRTTVHIFYTDTKTDGRLLLIFEGEISGVSLTKTSGTRMVLLDCVSIANHWEFTSKTGTSLKSYSTASAQATSKLKVEFTTQSTKPGSVPADIEEQGKIVDAMSGVDGVPTITAPTSEEEVEKLARKAVSQISAISTTSLSQISGLATVVGNVLRAGDGIVDTLGILAREISNSFAKINVGYFMPHVVYRITDRFFGFYNEKINNIMQNTLTTSMMEQSFNNLGNGSTMITTLMSVLQLLNYKMITPTAPTYDDDTQAPQSYVLVPNPSSFTPMACNTIFPDEVTNAHFSRSFLSEPTRMGNVAQAASSSVLGDGGIIPTSLIIAPTNRLTYDPSDNGSASIQLTFEERLRGVNSTIMKNDFDGLVSRIEAERLMGKAVTGEGPAAPPAAEARAQDQEYILDLRRRYLDAEYQNAVLKNRAFNLTTTYSPYRICGMPGIFLDDKLPSICGLLGQISTTISADGHSESSINFVNPILIRGDKESIVPGKGDLSQLSLEELLVESGWAEEDTLNNDLLKKGWPFNRDFWYTVPGIDEATVSLSYGWEDTSNKRAAWTAHLIHKLKNPEEQKFLNSWFDEETYFPDKIGQKVYMKMMYGVSYTDEKAEDDVDWEITENEDDDKYFKAGDSNLDGSIGKYRNKLENLEFGTGLKDNTENTEWISHFISRINLKYSSRSDEGKLDFINKFTRRNIITDSQFWTFLAGVENINDIGSNSVEGDIIVALKENLAEITAAQNGLDDTNSFIAGGATDSYLTVTKQLLEDDIAQLEVAKGTIADAIKNKGVRSIMGSLGDERGEVVALQQANGSNASAPFVKERRDVVRSLQKALKGNGEYYINHNG